MASTVNAAIAGFIAQLEASNDLTFIVALDSHTDLTGADVVVHDGPPTTAESSDWLAVGYQPGSTESVTMSRDWAGIGAMRSEETYDLLCSLAVTSGDEDMASRRTRAIAILDAVAAAISTDRTLGGAVRLAHLTEAVMHQEQTSRGSSVGFAFTLSASARITT